MSAISSRTETGTAVQVRRRRPAIVACAIAAILLPGITEASAQMGGFGGGGGFRGGGGGGGFGRGTSGGSFGGLNRMPSRFPDAGMQRIPYGKGRPGSQGSGGMSDGAAGSGCRRGDCPRPPRPGGRLPRGPGGVIVGVPPMMDPPGRPPPRVVMDDDEPARPLRASRKSGKKSPPPSPQASRTSSRRSSALLPPAGERRFVPDQVVVMLRDDLTDSQIDRLLRSNRLARTSNGGERIALLNARVFRFRITDGRSVSAVITALGRDAWVLSAQPNYIFALGQDRAAPDAAGQDAGATQYVPASVALQPEAAPVLASFGPLQYAVRKLHLDQAHQMARGDQVLVAVIDSRIDASHPEFAGSIVKEIDVLDDKDLQPHAHGTAMAGAIVARSRLTGVAPAAKVIAVRAFGTTAFGITTGTSFDLARALDRAATAGARVFNLSFAGPNDPLLQRAITALHGRGSVLIAAVGNAGPKSAALFPAADPNVIAVTATDTDDQVFVGANRGAHIAVAAPGVDILVPGPGGSYEMTTGTSIAAAHVSGLAALLISHENRLDSKAIRRLLTQSARDLGVKGMDSDYGAGLADAQKALDAIGSRGGAEVSGASAR